MEEENTRSAFYLLIGKKKGKRKREASLGCF